MVVVTVIAILSAMAVVGYPYYIKSSRDGVRGSIMNDVRTALELYYLRNLNYPNSPNDFCGLIPVLTGGNYLLVLPLDPATQTSICNLSSDGNRYTGGAMYTYIATPSSGVAASYLLKLSKESGGFADFYSPQ